MRGGIQKSNLLRHYVGTSELKNPNSSVPLSCTKNIQFSKLSHRRMENPEDTGRSQQGNRTKGSPWTTNTTR